MPADAVPETRAAGFRTNGAGDPSGRWWQVQPRTAGEHI